MCIRDRNKSPNFFFKGILPAQLVAFSTSSSAATLPVTMDRVHNNLNVKKEVSSFVLPIGATINMDGTAVYQAIAAVFIAQTFGLDLSNHSSIRDYSNSNISINWSSCCP